MKIFNKILGIALLAVSFTFATTHKAKAQEEGGYVSDQEFYDDLQPYGTWVNDEQYGNVWVPDADENFRPYATNGYWAQTDYGSTWVSNYPWGWATFHYGRWRYDDYYGWEWIPGHEWAPAWVSWRHGGGYYGWAPLMPGISISVSFGNSYNVPNNYWVCAPERYINSRNVYNYYTPPSRTVNIIHRTTIINNTYVYNNQTYIRGPRPQDIQRITHQRVPVYKISNANRPGVGRIQNNTVNIYRPAIRKSADARPTRVVNAQAYRQANPKQGIGSKGTGGYNRTNATKLAQVARSAKPNARLVNVGPVNNRKPGQPGSSGAVTPQQRQKVEQKLKQATPEQRQQAEQKIQEAKQATTPQQRQQAEQKIREATPQQRQQAEQKIQQASPQQRQQAEQKIQQAKHATSQQRQQAEQKIKQATPQQRQQVEQKIQQASPEQRQQAEQKIQEAKQAQQNGQQQQVQQREQQLKQQAQQRLQQQQQAQQQQRQQQQAQQQRQQQQQAQQQQKQQQQAQQRQQQQQAQQQQRQQQQTQQRQQQQQAQQQQKQQQQAQQRQQQQQGQQQQRQQQAQQRQQQQAQRQQQQRQQQQKPPQEKKPNEGQ